MTDYPRPALTVDCVVFNGWESLLLIRRGKEPFAGRWALPGGYVNKGETVELAALRELKEETGLSLTIGTHRAADLKLSGVYSKPDRDPRGWVVSVAFCADLVDAEFSLAVRGMDDAAEARWVPLKDVKLDDMAFDHAEIIMRAAKRLGRDQYLSF